MAIPALFQKGSMIRLELEDGMLEFKVTSEDTWVRLMALASRTGKASAVRVSRQNGNCRCYERKRD